MELIGGIEPAREYGLRALEEGKPLVTANKQLLSQHGDELFEAARGAARSCATRPPSRAWCRSSG